MSFRLYSDDLKEGEFLTSAQVFNGFGHSGSNISPHLAWSDAPAGTQLSARRASAYQVAGAQKMRRVQRPPVFPLSS